MNASTFSISTSVVAMEKVKNKRQLCHAIVTFSCKYFIFLFKEQTCRGAIVALYSEPCLASNFVFKHTALCATFLGQMIASSAWNQVASCYRVSCLNLLWHCVFSCFALYRTLEIKAKAVSYKYGRLLVEYANGCATRNNSQL